MADGTGEKARNLEAAFAQIERKYGKGAIMRMGGEGERDIDVIPTGSLSIDRALGVGGLPRGRIIEIYGPEASGKTTLTLHVIASAQSLGGIAAFIDVEHALDINYAKNLGINIEELLVSQPDTGEQALEIVEMLVRSGAVDLVVVDSVAALVPRVEIEGEMGDSHVALQARLMSQALRKLTGVVSRSNCCILFTNQIREKIGVVFGNPEVTPGGRALKFYTTVRMEVRRIGSLKVGGDNIGNRSRVKVVKNKVAPPFKEAEFDIIFGLGINRVGEVIDLGVEAGVIEKSGSWFSYDGERLGQGKENVKEALDEKPEMLAAIEAKVRDFFGIPAMKGAAKPKKAAEPE
ncbi:MAG: recombinase RecA [Candidatus Coatesbacteria bacterium RBG_13_66_14]|uniref:Protein RecA n=1 Tax=Candidatus Coatesbacteria bacterium RBG_13_66_14 TaxID=1817816 RepID=A0A1F5FAX4_9BACT|nr:MAG: recombinase RecA [Candidatus Coatesbacteria bacterium RBG_13_66_14]